jgi:hypothetical protein
MDGQYILSSGIIWTEESHYSIANKQGKAIPVVDHGGTQDCKTSKLPHFLDNRLTDGSEVISVTRQLPLNPRKIPVTHFC